MRQGLLLPVSSSRLTKSLLLKKYVETEMAAPTSRGPFHSTALSGIVEYWIVALKTSSSVSLPELGNSSVAAAPASSAAAAAGGAASRLAALASCSTSVAAAPASSAS